ncbi:MAG: hypothetical protein AAGN35_02260 [Bacteroidota bacterium]
MNTIILKLTVEEVNDILAALGNMPYAKVYDVINKIHQQATKQAQDHAENPPAKAKKSDIFKK